MSLMSNAKWVAFSQVFKILTQLVNIVYLSRLIPPGEYGLMAMALVVTNFGLLIRDLGTAAAIIQKKELEDRVINSVFWLNVFIGIGVALCIVIFSPLISIFFHEPKLTFVLIFLSLMFPISSSSAAHLALLERHSQFKRISSIEIGSSLISVIIALLMAYYDFGVYSLVCQSIMINLLSTLQFWRASNWRPSVCRMFDFSGLRDILGFSANLSLFSLINYFSRNADSLIIGRFMASSVLGAYNLAYRIMLFPLQSLTFVATRSLFPILSKNQDDHVTLKKTYLDCIFVILLIVVPLMSGLAFLSKPFVVLVFGEKWNLTSEILVWLAPTAIIQSVLSSSGSVFMAKGRTDILMKLGLLGMVLYVVAFLLGAQYNVVTLAKFYFIANVINFFPAMHIMMKLIEGSLLDILYKCYKIFIADIVMLLSLLFISSLSFFSSQSWGVLISLSLFGGGVYVVVCFLFMKEIRSFIFSRMSKGANSG